MSVCCAKQTQHATTSVPKEKFYNCASKIEALAKNFEAIKLMVKPPSTPPWISP